MNQPSLASSSPYPGLRPFSAEEAIFYCGRESHVEVICDLLRQNKFLMVAGASGDGKSSLVFAGLIPAMQAGFFQARHSEFRIASFRPERSPMENLASSLAGVMGEPDFRSLQARLNYGFSSLADIYREATGEGDSGYNLVIYADQFEELFTYPENYRDGKCSAEAQLLVNLLLETSRISLEHNLPVYVVCTMRSDYIGQCSSFRGLAEYIGFSHYFVPRLNRLEMKRVIEEPAMLNGDDISPRLVERLLYDLEEGNDQLPVLQHALSRIWLLAGEMGQAMDLLHYAMAGGMAGGELPEENQADFYNWLELQPPELQPIFSRPGLDNVLNLHAEGLLVQAVEICNQDNTGGEKSDGVPGEIFRCLTQIDRGRVVRHQISAEELLQILGIPGLRLETLDRVTGVFRQPGNTFLRPFISENSPGLKASSVLDITHESLIRNWDKLAGWTEAEEKDKQTFHDFDKQLQRWLENGKSSDYLLPIGPLTQFEAWFNRKNPNAGWLAGLDAGDETRDNKLTRAEIHLENAREFLHRSSRRLLLTRTVMKYGANRILLLAGSLVVVFACLYYYAEYRYKQNPAVVERVLEEGQSLMASPNVSKVQKARFAILWERHHGENSFVPLLDSLHNDTLAIDIGLEMYEGILGQEEELKLSPSGDFLPDTSLHPLLPQLCVWMEKRIRNLSSGAEISHGQARRIAQFVLMASAIHQLGGRPQHRIQAENAAGLLLQKYLLPLAANPANGNLCPTVFFQAVLEAAYLVKDTESLRRLYARIGPGSARYGRLFPEGDDFDLPGFGKIPRLGGPLLQQFLSERCGDFRVSDSLSRANQKAMAGSSPVLLEEIRMHHFGMGMLAGRANSPDGSDCNAVLNRLFELRRVFRPGLAFTLFIPAGYVLDMRMKREAVERFTRWIQNPAVFFPESSASPDPFRISMLHRLRSIWFSGYGLAAQSRSEGRKSISSLPVNGIPDADLKLQNYLDSRFESLTIRESRDNNRILETGTFSKSVVTGAGWTQDFINRISGSPLAGTKSFRKFLNENLADFLARDSVVVARKRVWLTRIFEDAERQPAMINRDSLLAFRLWFDLKKDSALDAAVVKRAGKTGTPEMKRLAEFRQRLPALKAPGLLNEIAFWLAMRGQVNDALRTLDRLTLNGRRLAVARIVEKTNLSGAYAEFMPALLDKAFLKGEEKPVFPPELFSAISSTGGLRFVWFGFDLLREQEERKKPRALHEFIRGLCQIRMLHLARQYIPNESSSDGRLRLLNLILEFEESPARKEERWKNLHFPYYTKGVMIIELGNGGQIELEN